MHQVQRNLRILIHVAHRSRDLRPNLQTFTRQIFLTLRSKSRQQIKRRLRPKHRTPNALERQQLRSLRLQLLNPVPARFRYRAKHHRHQPLQSKFLQHQCQIRRRGTARGKHAERLRIPRNAFPGQRLDLRKPRRSIRIRKRRVRKIKYRRPSLARRP